MKVIFLDIDGVLNDEQTFIDIHKEWEQTGVRRVEINLKMMERLKHIVEATQAKIVLSSSWRFGFDQLADGSIKARHSNCKELVSLLNEYNLTLHDLTGRGSKRQDEIKEWLEAHENIESFVIIDDETYDMMDYYNQGVVVKTSFIPAGVMIREMKDTSGLQEEHVQQAIKILNKGDVL